MQATLPGGATAAGQRTVRTVAQVDALATERRNNA